MSVCHIVNSVVLFLAGNVKREGHAGNNLLKLQEVTFLKMVNVTDLCLVSPGHQRSQVTSRRNFICRMRCAEVPEEQTAESRGKEPFKLHVLDEEYAVVHCTGYLKVIEGMVTDITLIYIQ